MELLSYCNTGCLFVCVFVCLQYGLTKMLQSEQGLIIFVMAMDPFNENMMADVLRVAAAVCFVADG